MSLSQVWGEGFSLHAVKYQKQAKALRPVEIEPFDLMTLGRVPITQTIILSKHD